MHMAEPEEGVARPVIGAVALSALAVSTIAIFYLGILPRVSSTSQPRRSAPSSDRVRRAATSVPPDRAWKLTMSSLEKQMHDQPSPENILQTGMAFLGLENTLVLSRWGCSPSWRAPSRSIP